MRCRLIGAGNRSVGEKEARVPIKFPPLGCGSVAVETADELFGGAKLRKSA